MNIPSIQVIDRYLPAGDDVGRPDSRYHTFPSLARCSDGSFICTALVGTTKSGPDGRAKVFRSTDGCKTWAPIPSPTQWDEQAHPRCGYLMCHITELSPGHLLASYMRADRFNPDEPLFHPTTSGMQRTVVRLSSSKDNGATWSEPWDLDYSVPDLIAPGRIIRLPDGALGMPFEVWHEWDKGFREGPSTRMVLSRDEGRTWPQAGILARDEKRQVIYGDPRPTFLPDGRIVVLTWVHNFVAGQDLPVHRSESADNGRTWSPPVSTELIGQIANPVSLGNNLMIAVYQRRFGDGIGMRGVLSKNHGRTWIEQTDTLLWGMQQKLDTSNPFSGYDTFAFGYSTAMKLPDNTVLVPFWAGNGTTTCIRILQLKINEN